MSEKLISRRELLKFGGKAAVAAQGICFGAVVCEALTLPSKIVEVNRKRKLPPGIKRDNADKVMTDKIKSGTERLALAVLGIEELHPQLKYISKTKKEN